MGKHGGIDKVNSEHNARNNDHTKGVRQGQRAGGSGRDTATIAGSMSMHQKGPTQRMPPSDGSSKDVKALARVAGGRTETGKK